MVFESHLKATLNEGKQNNLNDYESYMNGTKKIPSNVRILVKGNLPINTSELLLLFYNLIYFRFIQLVENLNLKNK